ncbi:hypothetical protein EDB83DRAFT_2514525 [Lactarius deliciosus]|nr:hypothetical protein EDB83DRAFT_2514525 [Lactarius deliciosus]
MVYVLILLFLLVQCGRAQQTFFPPAIPLAVRSPYLSSWDFTTHGTTIGKLWSTTSAHQPNSTINDNLSIPVHVRVDGVTYSFLGYSPSVNGSVNLTNTVITPTQTKLIAQVGPMEFNLTFLNPIEPGNWVKQSIPFSYLSLTAESLDGAAHAVQVYSDVSGEWLSADRSQEIIWSTTAINNVIYHMAQLKNPAVFNEIGTQAEWGTLYYAIGSGGENTFKTGLDADCRGLFQLRGTLDNLTDPNYRAISPDFPVFALSRDLGIIQATKDPVVWTVGFTTDPAIQYTDPFAAPQHRSLFYKIQYPDDTTLIPDFLDDFANASSRAQELTQRYSLYGSIQLTIGFDASGNFNQSDVMAFMKNIDGSNTSRVNAVETLYSAFPAFMYIDPKLAGLLLEPLFQLQASPNYTLPYAAADLGLYPNVTISNSGHSQRVEQSGNMLIMTYAHARASGDGSLISRYYSLLISWADYLSNYTLYTPDETSADGLTTGNQTNLAIKGIIAIRATVHDELSCQAEGRLRQVLCSIQPRSFTVNGKALHWLVINTYSRHTGSRARGTALVESSVYDSQSSFIYNITATLAPLSAFGVPVDSYSADMKIIASSWTLFVAAMTSDEDLLTNLVSRVHSRASLNTSVGVFPVYYDSASGLTYRGEASPAQGAMYAPLALAAPVLQITANPVTTGTSSQPAIAIALEIEVSHRLQSIRSWLKGGVIDPDLPMMATPFDSTLAGVTELETQTSQQQRWAGAVEPEIVPLVHASDSPMSSPPLTPIPAGLSSKELARLRRDISRSRSADALPSGSSLPPMTGPGVATSSSEARRLQSEVEALRREMQQFRVDTVGRFEAPPGYEDGHYLGIPVHVRVDNITYSFLGGSPRVNGKVNLTNTVVTPTQTKLAAQAGPMRFNLTFLNPIEPGDWVKQSIPFSYLSLTAESLDGAAHAVQVYSDVSGEWLSGDRSHGIRWNTTGLDGDSVICHTAKLQNPAVFNEIKTQAEWGTLYYAMKAGENVTWTAGPDDYSRGSFQVNGTLNNLMDQNSRSINSNYPIFGISTRPRHHPSNTGSHHTPRQRSLFYKTQYPKDESLIPGFLDDFPQALLRAQQLDLKILRDTATISGALGDLVSLATAQVYGSIQLTVGLDASGNFNQSDVMAFMKNIGGSYPNRVNAVETLYSAFPTFMYIDPKLGGLLLEPLFHFQASPNYCHQKTNKTGQYSLLTSWADYLSNSTLLNHDQTSADGLATKNQTNLAIKGIIAIEAMSKMSSVVKQTTDAEKYSKTAASLYGQWKGLALDSGQHLLAAYGLVNSWSLGYNLYADVWLGTGVVESSVYDGQSSFINNYTLTSTSSNFGLPVDSYTADISDAASSWTLFVAAMTSDKDLSTNLISRVHTRASYNATMAVFPVFYDSASGSATRGEASPAQGAMYAPLALKVLPVQITADPVTIASGTSPESKSHTGPIAGGAAGGVAALLAIGVIAIVARRRRRRSRRRKSIGSLFESDFMEPDLPMTLTPFNPIHTGVAELGTGSQTNWQRQSVEPEIVPLVHAPTPSDSPMPSPRMVPVPVGLSSKELARLREDNSRSQSTDALTPGPSSTAIIEQGIATSPLEARRLQSEVEALRREMQQLRVERFEAPPGYASEDGDV